MICEFCGSDQLKPHLVREMMFGSGDHFTYLECLGCRCLRISAVPLNLSQHYPSSYDPFNAKANGSFSARLRQFLTTFAIKNRWALHAAPRALFSIARLIHSLRITPDMRILDVGCGAGRLVLDLRAAGFAAWGIDRFAPDVSDSHGLAIRQCELKDVQEQFDCIMFNHSLEHIADQVETLRLAYPRLRAGGICIVRVPVVGWAWEKYGPNWVQLDPPRHLCIHSRQSFRLAAEKAGFVVTDIVYDSTDFQFWASELYCREIPLETGVSHLSRYFSRKRMSEYRRRAAELNLQSQGDAAIFFCRAASPEHSLWVGLESPSALPPGSPSDLT